MLQEKINTSELLMRYKSWFHNCNSVKEAIKILYVKIHLNFADFQISRVGFLPSFSKQKQRKNVEREKSKMESNFDPFQ